MAAPAPQQGGGMNRKVLYAGLGLAGVLALVMLLRGSGSSTTGTSATDPSLMPPSTFADNGSSAGALSDAIGGLNTTNNQILGDLDTLLSNGGTVGTSSAAPPPPDTPGPQTADTAAAAVASAPPMKSSGFGTLTPAPKSSGPWISLTGRTRTVKGKTQYFWGTTWHSQPAPKR